MLVLDLCKLLSGLGNFLPSLVRILEWRCVFLFIQNQAFRNRPFSQGSPDVGCAYILEESP